MLYSKKKTGYWKADVPESTVHEANNGQLCVHVMSKASKLPYNIVTVKQFLWIHQYLDLDSFNLTQWTKTATIC